MEIESLRKKIDDTDSKILELLNSRAKVVQEVGKMKIKSGRRDFYIPHREKKIISGLIKQSKGPLDS